MTPSPVTRLCAREEAIDPFAVHAAGDSFAPYPHLQHVRADALCVDCRSTKRKAGKAVHPVMSTSQRVISYESWTLAIGVRCRCLGHRTRYSDRQLRPAAADKHRASGGDAKRLTIRVRCFHLPLAPSEARTN